jgi:hypothetical protein
VPRFSYPDRMTFPQELQDFLAQVPEHLRRCVTQRTGTTVPSHSPRTVAGSSEAMFQPAPLRSRAASRPPRRTYGSPPRTAVTAQTKSGYRWTEAKIS